MPGVESYPVLAQYQLVRYDFEQHNVAISQAQVALQLNVNGATSGSLLNVGYPAINSGCVVGITANLLAVISHVTLQLSPTIAAAEVASTHPLYRVSMAVATPAIINSFIDYGIVGSSFAKGQLLGMKITTDSGFLPNGSADLYASLWVLYDPIQL